MENTSFNSIADTYKTILADAQSNAINTEDAVQQVLLVSGKDNHDKVIDAILADNGLDISKKIEMVRGENEYYDRKVVSSVSTVERLQGTQTSCVCDVVKTCTENWYWIALIGSACFLLGTPKGRQLITDVAKLASV